MAINRPVFYQINGPLVKESDGPKMTSYSKMKTKISPLIGQKYEQWFDEPLILVETKETRSYFVKINLQIQFFIFLAFNSEKRRPKHFLQPPPQMECTQR